MNDILTEGTALKILGRVGQLGFTCRLYNVFIIGLFFGIFRVILILIILFRCDKSLFDIDSLVQQIPNLLSDSISHI